MLSRRHCLRSIGLEGHLWLFAAPTFRLIIIVGVGWKVLSMAYMGIGVAYCECWFAWHIFSDA